MWLFNALSNPEWRPLTLTLLHFLWQGMLVALVWQAIFWLFASRSAQARYVLGLMGMFMMAACPVVTFTVLETKTAHEVSQNEAFLAAPSRLEPSTPARNLS